MFLFACGSLPDEQGIPTPEATNPRATQQELVQETGQPEEPSYQNPFPLAEPGSYWIGKRSYDFIDATRNNREVGIVVWYPALPPEAGGSKRIAYLDEELDPDGAPYPVIISSAKMGSDLAVYLVSHGFVWVGVTNIDTYYNMNSETYNQPLDILFALDLVAIQLARGS